MSRWATLPKESFMTWRICHSQVQLILTQPCHCSWLDYYQGEWKHHIWSELIRSYPCFKLIYGLHCSRVQSLNMVHMFCCNVLPSSHLQQYCPQFFLSLACWSFLGLTQFLNSQIKVTPQAMPFPGHTFYPLSRLQLKCHFITEAFSN